VKERSSPIAANPSFARNNIVFYFKTDSAFVPVKPGRRDVSYPVSTCGPLAAASSSVRRVPLFHESSTGRRLPRRTAALTVAHDVIHPTPIGQVLILW